MIRGWRLSVAERFDRAFGENEAVKCALAANLAYWHDDPATLWWVLFAVAQGGYIGSGGCYVRGGSQRLKCTRSSKLLRLLVATSYSGEGQLKF